MQAHRFTKGSWNDEKIIFFKCIESDNVHYSDVPITSKKLIIMLTLVIL